MTTTRLTRRAALRLALGGGAALAVAGRERGRLYERVGLAFGTTVSIKLEAQDAAAAERALAAGFAEIRRVDRVASLTRERGDVFRLNRDGCLSNPDPALIEMLRVARAMHEATDGAYDVTVQPLWLALDAAAKRGTWPSEAEIAEILRRVDQTKLRFDETRVAFAEPGMSVTLNSLARGLAADKVAAALRREGVERAFIDTDVLAARGRRPDGGAWSAGVRDPRDGDRVIAVSPLDGCLSTSGDYEYSWSADFARHHILDARRGVSPADYASVSVLAPSGLWADALSTSAFLVGAEKAPTLLRRFTAEALFVEKSGAISRTPGFAVRA